jgi:CelD/BcsL family acetyltransferase involved in cellulose biosynthesis
VLEVNLASRHSARPVHTLADITLLAERFPQHIAFHGALQGDTLLAGVVSFTHGGVVHAQYIASSEDGQAASALDGLFHHLIEQARAQGARVFDFGICNEDQGRVLNEGLYRFKSEFGGGGTVHEFYTLALRALPATT